MTYKRITIKIIIAIVVTFIFNSCGKNIIGACHQSFAFKIDAKVYPDKDSVNVGDTIFIEINIPIMLTDSSSGERLNLDGATRISTDIGFVKLVSDSPIVLDDAVPDFDFKIISGKELSTSKPKLIKLYSFVESMGQILFKLAIVPKYSGTFRFNLGSAPDVQEKNSRCPTFTLNYLLQNTTDQHYYLYPGGTGVTPAGADYYFYVR